MNVHKKIKEEKLKYEENIIIKNKKKIIAQSFNENLNVNNDENNIIKENKNQEKETIKNGKLVIEKKDSKENDEITEEQKEELLKFTECNICLGQAKKPLSCPQCQFLICEECFLHCKRKNELTQCPCCKKSINPNDLIKLPVVNKIQTIINENKNKDDIFSETDKVFKENMDLIDGSLLKYEKCIKYHLDIQKTVKNFRHDFLTFISSFKREIDCRCDTIIKESIKKMDISVVNQLNLINLKTKQSNKINKEQHNQKEKIKDSIENIFLLGKKLSSPLETDYTSSQKFIDPVFKKFESKKINIPSFNEKQIKQGINLGPLKFGYISFETNDDDGSVTCYLKLNSSISETKKFFVAMCIATDISETKFHLELDNDKPQTFSKNLTLDELFNGDLTLKEKAQLYFQIYYYSVI